VRCWVRALPFKLDEFQVYPGYRAGASTATATVQITGPFDSLPDVADWSARFTTCVAKELDIEMQWPEGRSYVAVLLAAYRAMIQRLDPFLMGIIDELPVADAEVSETEVGVMVPVADQGLARAAVDVLVSLLNDQSLAADEADTKVRNAVNRLQAIAKSRPRLSISNQPHLLAAAHQLGIPVMSVNQGHAILGLGRAQRQFKSTMSDRTSALACEIAQIKSRTSQLLAMHGLPHIQRFTPPTAVQAVNRAKLIGYPVVVKPDNLDRGQGVMTWLEDADAVTDAFRQVKKMGCAPVLERHVMGDCYRLTVEGEHVVKAVRRLPGGVTGDGIATIEQLVARRAEDAALRRKASDRENFLIALDDEAQAMLRRQGLTPESIPFEDQFVRLRRTDNVSTGGSNDVLDLDADIHAANIALALDVARAVGLDIAGIDIISRDIAVPWYDNGGVVCEVNAMPQIGVGTSPQIYQEILQREVPDLGVIPVEIVIARHANCVNVEDLKLEITTRGVDGFSSGRGVWVGAQLVTPRVGNTFHAARALLLNRNVSQAVCLMNLHDVETLGLPVRHCHSITVLADEDMDVEALKKTFAAHAHEFYVGEPVVYSTQPQKQNPLH